MNRTCCNKPMKLIAATWHCRVNEECLSYFDNEQHAENIKRDKGKKKKKIYRSVRGLNDA